MSTDRTAPIGLLQGLTYTYPIEGAIRTGTTVERQRSGQSMKLPSKLDEFIITTKHKGADGQWVRHPLDATLRAECGQDDADGVRKLRRIPVTLSFDRPELSLSEQYAAFSNQGRPICVGNGAEAKRRIMGDEGYHVESCACPGAGNCEFGETARCDTFLRLMVRLEGQSEMDGLFILRTGSINGVTDTRTFIEHLARTLGGRLAGVPLWLTLEAKQSAMSRQSVFWYASFRPRFASLIEAATQLNTARDAEVALGIDRAAGEQVLVDLRANGSFADQAEEDGAQFDDLIAARFMDTTDDGQHQVEVRSRRRAVTKSPGAAADATMAQLQTLLGGKSESMPTGDAEPEPQAEVATKPLVTKRAPSAPSPDMRNVGAMALPTVHGLDGSPAPSVTAAEQGVPA